MSNNSKTIPSSYPAKYWDIRRKAEILLARFRRNDEDVWQSLPGEPATWYARFRLYLSLGLTRSIKAACKIDVDLQSYNNILYVLPEPVRDTLVNAHKRPPLQAWKYYAWAWLWQERAEEFDKYQINLLHQQQEERVQRAKQRRLDIIEQFTEKVYQALQVVDFTSMPLSQFAVAVKTILEQGRIEFEGAPSGNINQHIHQQEIRIEFARPVDFYNNTLPTNTTANQIIDSIPTDPLESLPAPKNITYKIPATTCTTSPEPDEIDTDPHDQNY